MRIFFCLPRDPESEQGREGKPLKTRALLLSNLQGKEGRKEGQTLLNKKKKTTVPKGGKKEKKWNIKSSGRDHKISRLCGYEQFKVRFDSNWRGGGRGGKRRKEEEDEEEEEGGGRRRKRKRSRRRRKEEEG